MVGQFTKSRLGAPFYNIPYKSSSQALNAAHELLSVKLGVGFDLGQAKRRISAIESQLDSAIAKQEKLF